MNIELRKYNYFPNMEQLREAESFDYICLAFEISTNENGKKENLIQAVGYLLIDHYNNEVKVSFEIPSHENDTDSWFFFRQEDQKIKSKLKERKFSLENNSQGLTLKRKEVVSSLEEAKGITSFIGDFLEKDLLPDIQSIKPFLKNNNIDFDNIELEKFFKEYLTAMVEHFSEKKLSELLGERYKKIDSTLMHNMMERTMDLKENNKKPKI